VNITENYKGSQAKYHTDLHWDSLKDDTNINVYVLDLVSFRVLTKEKKNI
jgi:hypothetical protein